MSASSTDPARPSRGTVHIYIDNSNLWIQGQKTYAEKKRQTVSWDPTWRFDAGRVKALLTRNSRLRHDEMDFNVKIYLYGSTPPPVDTVWEAIKSHDVKVNTFARSTWTGREKQVDHEMSLESVIQAVEDRHAGLQSEFIIVSGDRDLYSAVFKIVRQGFPVHVWSWKNCLARVYTSHKEELIQVHHLDDYLEEIGFRETTFRVERNTINPHSIVVLDPLPKSDEIQGFISGLRTPVYRYVCAAKRADASSQDLIIIPAFARRMEHEELTKLFQTAKSKLETCGLSVLTYFEYCQRYHRESSKDELAISNRFQELPLQEGGVQRGSEDIEDNDSKVTNNDDGFIEVNRHSEQHRTRFQKDTQRARTLCRWGKYCVKREDCKFGHTKDDEEYIKTYGPKKAKKYKLCMKSDCIRGKNCSFAHSREELLCPTCDKIGVGHEIGECISG